MGLNLATAARPSARPHARSQARLNGALLVSVLAHGLLLSLTFGTGRGLPGLELPWSTWDAAPELQVALQPEPVPAPPRPTPTPTPAPAPA
ncbi:MAG: protein TolA, partial [Roseateles sp.]